MLGKLRLLVDRHGRQSTNLKIGDGAVLGTAECGNAAVLTVITLVLLSCSASKAQLPDALSELPNAPGVVAPLKRYSFNLGMDSKYSLTNSVLEFTPRIGVAMRLGERETVGLSYSHPMPANVSATQSNSVIVWTSFRVMSWGKIPKGH